MTNVVQFPRSVRSAPHAPVDAGGPVPGSLLAAAAQLREDAANVRESMAALRQAVEDLKTFDLPARAREIAEAAVDGDLPACHRSAAPR